MVAGQRKLHGGLLGVCCWDFAGLGRHADTNGGLCVPIPFRSREPVGAGLAEPSSGM